MARIESRPISRRWGGSGEVSTGSLTLAEETAGSFQVSLGAQPSGNMTVTVSNPIPGTISIGNGTLTFTPGNWSQGQTVTVTALNDPDGFHSTTTLTVASGSLSRTLSVSVADNDLISLSRSSTTICEGIFLTAIPIEEHEFNVALSAAPFSGGSATVTLETQPPLNVEPMSFTFSDPMTRSIFLYSSQISRTTVRNVVVSSPGQTPRTLEVVILDDADPECSGPPPGPRCGDNVCNGNEDFRSCPQDCEPCQLPSTFRIGPLALPIPCSTPS